MNMSEYVFSSFSFFSGRWTFNNNALTVTNHTKIWKTKRRRRNTPNSIHSVSKWMDNIVRCLLLLSRFVNSVRRIILIIFDIWNSVWNLSFWICLFSDINSYFFHRLFQAIKQNQYDIYSKRVKKTYAASQRDSTLKTFLINIGTSFN